MAVWDEEEPLTQETQVGHDTKPPRQEEEMSQADLERESVQLDKEIIEEIQGAFHFFPIFWFLTISRHERRRTRRDTHESGTDRIRRLSFKDH